MRPYLKLSCVLSIALVVGVVGLRRAAAQGGRVRAAIEAGNKKFISGAAKGDAIEKLWKVLDSGINAFELVTTEVASQGNLAYEVGTYAMKMKDGKVADRGKYCVVWKRINGQWLLHRDIWTTNLPEAKK